MAWQNTVAWLTAEDVVDTEEYSGARTLQPAASERVHVKANSGGTTDSLIVGIQTTLDDESEEWTTVPEYSFVLDCTSGADCITEFTVSGCYRYRVTLEADGSTDTIVVDLTVRNDGIAV